MNACRQTYLHAHLHTYMYITCTYVCTLSAYAYLYIHAEMYADIQDFMCINTYIQTTYMHTGLSMCVCTKQAESAHRTRLGEYTCTECTICGYIVACTWCCSIYLTHVFHISCCGVVAGREERKPRHHQEPQSSGQSRTTRTTLRSTMYVLNRPSQ